MTYLPTGSAPERLLESVEARLYEALFDAITPCSTV